MNLKRIVLTHLAIVWCILPVLGAHATELAGWLEADGTRLKAAELRQVEHSLRAIERLELEPRTGRMDYFSTLFGGPRGADVVEYLRARIHYLGKDTDDTDGSTYAYNSGTAWFDLLYKKEVLGQESAHATTAPFKHGTIAITSPRTGLVILGSAFTADDTTDFDRMETLVHEARHSDCPVQLGHKDLEAFAQGRYSEISHEGRFCTNMHMPCPRGHPLAGDLACDAHPWGGYMVGYVFAEAVFKRCPGCSERERQQALVTAKEDLTRLSPELREGLRAGTLPAPVMESLP